MYSKKVHILNLSLAQLIPKCVLLLSLCKSQATKNHIQPVLIRFCTQQKKPDSNAYDVVHGREKKQLASQPILKETGEGRSKSTKPTHYCTIGSLSSMWVLKAQWQWHLARRRRGEAQVAAAVGIAKMQVNVRQRLHDLLRTWATPNKRLGFRVCQNGGKKVRSC